MKKKLLAAVLIAVCMVSGCAILEPTCRFEECEETVIYEDGYCKTHYYMNVGDNLLKDLFNY